MPQKKIALLAGGYSGEYEVSINSAKNIAEQLDPAEFQVYTIIVKRDRWFYESGGEQVDVNKNDFSVTIGSEKVLFDAAFITIHGTPGEDGKIQGYLDMLGIPYNTCDAATSALTMNKGYTKAVVNGIKHLHTAKSMQLFKKDGHDVVNISAALKFPLFIKPNNGGSSVGMSKVHNVAELGPALDKAFHEDSQVLVEEFIKGREFSIGVATLDGKLTVLPATEIISSKEFFDYEAKYTPGVTQEITPGNLTDEQNERVAGIVTEVYQRLNCKGMVRIDFIIDGETDNFYFIEINTTPGQSANSLIPQQVRAMGMKVGDFYAALLHGASTSI